MPMKLANRRMDIFLSLLETAARERKRSLDAPGAE